MGHIHNQRDGDLHHENGEHRTTAPTTKGLDLERFERRLKAHLELHRLAAEDEPNTPVKPAVPVVEFSAAATEAIASAELAKDNTVQTRKPKPKTVVKPVRGAAPKLAEPETVDRDEVYVWLSKEELTSAELDGQKLPARITAADMHTINQAMTTGKKNRREDDRWLVIADGRTRKIQGPAW